MGVVEVMILLASIGAFGLFKRSQRFRYKRHTTTLAPSVRRIVSVATSMAYQRRAAAGGEDVIYVALFDNDVVNRIGLPTPDLERLRCSLLEHILQRNADTPSEDYPIADLMTRAVTYANALQRAEVRSVELVACCVGVDTYVGRLLDEYGVRLEAAGRRFGVSALTYRDVPPASVRQVVIWRCDASPSDAATGMLQSCFDKTDVEALLLLHQLHDEGAASVGTYTLPEATDRVERARAALKENDLALQLSVEAADFQLSAGEPLREPDRRPCNWADDRRQSQSQSPRRRQRDAD